MNWETGVGVAFLLWAYHSVMIIVHANSQTDANFGKVGMRISWLTGTTKPLSPEAQNRPIWKNVLKYLFIVGTSLPFVLLSWLYVAFSVGTILWNWSKNQGAPQAVREFRWMMRNMDMDFDTLIRESLKLHGKPPEEFEKLKADTIAHMQDLGLR